MNLKAFAESIGIPFVEGGNLTQAIVHRSYLNENPDFALDHNERLEFLGDAVLELVVTEYLYKTFPNPEGELTNFRAALVNGQNLADIARGINLESQLLLSHGESKDTNSKARNKILANAMEATIGAVYLDSGWDAAKMLIERHVIATLPAIMDEQLHIDPKSRFQEAAQSRSSVTPNYKVLEETGPDHQKQFRIGVYVGKEMLAEGLGTSKQEAQVDAARQALKKTGW